MPRHADLATRFASRFESDPNTGCHVWTGHLYAGYGMIWASGRKVMAHRVAFEMTKGPIPAGMVLDHLCRNPACVNPAHLEPVTSRENILRGIGKSATNARKTTCDRGHELVGDNVRWSANGHCACRACIKLRLRERKLEKAAA